MYKVVRLLENGKRVSTFAIGAYAFRDKINHWVEAPSWLWQYGYGLCFFNEFKMAEKFALNVFLRGFDVEVWKIEAEEIILPQKPSLDLEILIDRKNHKLFILERWGDWPEGTMVAKRVKLKSLIKCFIRGQNEAFKYRKSLGLECKR